MVKKAPGQRIPRTVDEAELAVRAVLGQQVSTKAARTHAGRLVAAYGRPVHDAGGALTHTFPSVEQLLENRAIDPIHLAVPEGTTTDAHRPGRRARRRKRRPRRRQRLAARTRAVAGAARRRPLDRGGDRDARLG